MNEFRICYGSEILSAREHGRPVVALESTLIAHGLPRPENLRVAREVEQAVRDTGAVPATIGVLDGELTVGLDDAQLTRLATEDGVAKLSVRDLPVAAALGTLGATTVASTSAIAAAAGIRVFATGGLGGVHREAATTFDESADLTTLGRTNITVVCAGVKSILDVGATLERLETLGVAVVGYRTRRFPGFYLADGGFDLDWSVHRPAQVARIMRARAELGQDGSALVVAHPLPEDEQLDPALHDQALHSGLSSLDSAGITGKGVTPFLLAHFHEVTEGRSLDVNIRIIMRNAALAGEIAVAAAQ